MNQVVTELNLSIIRMVLKLGLLDFIVHKISNSSIVDKKLFYLFSSILCVVLIFVSEIFPFENFFQL